VRVQWGRYVGAVGIVDSAMFQKSVDYPDEHTAAYHVVLRMSEWLRFGGTSFLIKEGPQQCCRYLAACYVILESDWFSQQIRALPSEMYY